MAGIRELDRILSELRPVLAPEDWVFCTVSGPLQEHLHLSPLASFVEDEGLTLVVNRKTADDANIPYDGVFRRIVLSVHSSLAAVGLTAAVSTRLADEGISANVIAAYYHDHVFVSADRADAAVRALQSLAKRAHSP